MTRAKNTLYLTAARSRYLWGSLRMMQPSRFLSELPEEHLKKFHKETFAAYDLDVAPTNHEIGDLVFHKDFGKGMIQKVYNTSLGLTYDVLFHESGETRSLVAKYAKLAKL